MYCKNQNFLTKIKYKIYAATTSRKHTHVFQLRQFHVKQHYNRTCWLSHLYLTGSLKLLKPLQVIHRPFTISLIPLLFNLISFVSTFPSPTLLFQFFFPTAPFPPPLFSNYNSSPPLHSLPSIPFFHRVSSSVTFNISWLPRISCLSVTDAGIDGHQLLRTCIKIVAVQYVFYCTKALNVNELFEWRSKCTSEVNKKTCAKNM